MGLAGSGAELADLFGVGGITAWTGDMLLLSHQRPFAGDAGCRGRDTEFFQLPASVFTEPVSGPGRCDPGFNPGRNTPFLQFFGDHFFDQMGRRTAGISGRNGNDEMIIVPVHSPHNAKVDDGEHRNFGIRDFRQIVPDIFRADIRRNCHHATSLLPGRPAAKTAFPIGYGRDVPCDVPCGRDKRLIPVPGVSMWLPPVPHPPGRPIQRAGYKSTLSEQKKILNLGEDHLLVQSQRAIIESLSQQIKTLEKQCRKIIRSNENLAQQYRWITSIKGVGQQTAWHVIATTHGFTRFQKWRQLACYCGTAPFPYQSGSSIKGRTKVSHLANKNMKKLLNMCALSAIRHDKEIKAYYQKKIDQGKHKMCVINAERNKIIARIFAVVKRQSPFVETHKWAA